VLVDLCPVELVSWAGTTEVVVIRAALVVTTTVVGSAPRLVAGMVVRVEVADVVGKGTVVGAITSRDVVGTTTMADDVVDEVGMTAAVVMAAPALDVVVSDLAAAAEDEVVAVSADVATGSTFGKVAVVDNMTAREVIDELATSCPVVLVTVVAGGSS
jgi:hypothetical protein